MSSLPERNHAFIDVYIPLTRKSVNTHISVINNVFKHKPNNVSQDKRESILCRNAKILSGDSNLQRISDFAIILLRYDTVYCIYVRSKADEMASLV